MSMKFISLLCLSSLLFMLSACTSNNEPGVTNDFENDVNNIAEDTKDFADDMMDDTKDFADDMMDENSNADKGTDGNLDGQDNMTSNEASK